MQIILFLLISLSNSFLAYRLLRAFNKYRLKAMPDDLDFRNPDLPSVSVLIPARNEQASMRGCLERVLDSDYPKLEVIVLDDNSVDNTSEEIKRFAHSGVRFVHGETPPEGWLGRNYAYDRLSQEASGDLLLFLSVDTKISRYSVLKLVSFTRQNSCKMLSILPSRSDNYRLSVIFSSLRYYLELITMNSGNPPSSSGVWMIERKTLLDHLGGLKRYRQAIMPETEIARDLAAEDGGLFELEKPQYRFLLDEQKLGVDFEKRWSSQLQTQQRNFALKFFKHPAMIWLGLAVFSLHLLPFLMVWFKTATLNFDYDFWFFASQASISTVVYLCYTSLVWSRGAWTSLFIYPFVIIQEALIFISSVYQRFFGRMIWRGREINFRRF